MAASFFQSKMGKIFCPCFPGIEEGGWDIGKEPICFSVAWEEDAEGWAGFMYLCQDPPDCSEGKTVLPNILGKSHFQE